MSAPPHRNLECDRLISNYFTNLWQQPFFTHTVISNSADTSFGEQSLWRYEFVEICMSFFFVIKSAVGNCAVDMLTHMALQGQCAILNTQQKFTSMSMSASASVSMSVSMSASMSMSTSMSASQRWADHYCGIANCGIANCSMQWTTLKIAEAEQRNCGTPDQKQQTTAKIAVAEQQNYGLVAAHYGKNSCSGRADQRQRTTKFFKVADQREADALFLNSGPAEADYGKNSGSPSAASMSMSASISVSVYCQFPLTFLCRFRVNLNMALRIFTVCPTWQLYSQFPRPLRGGAET